VLNDFLGDVRHLCRAPHNYVLVALEEIDKLAFLFGVQDGPDLNSFGRVFGINLHGLSVLDRFDSAR
jgi:hypothetical protein